MARKLNTYVHVDGIAYGPEDDVPAEVAEKITAPDVWESPATAKSSPSDQSPAPAPQGPVERPSDRASKATWVEYAVTQGMTPEDADKLSRDQLAEKYPAE